MADVDEDNEKKRLETVPFAQTMKAIREFGKQSSTAFQCSWYWGNISWHEAERVLLGQALGTFMVRDSASERYIFTVSYRTSTSVLHTRLPRHGGYFCLGGQNSKYCLENLTRCRAFEPRKLFYTKIFGKQSEVIDRAMAVFLPGPFTFTGEDTAELFLHGSTAVIDSVSEILNTFDDVRPAKAGEFTKRAFFNSKMTVHEVNALSFLLSSETQGQRSLAVNCQEIGAATVSIREKLVQLLSDLEARIDFAEDVDFNLSGFLLKVGSLKEELEALQERTRRGTLVSNGVRTVIIGRTNVGKSSLLNRIAAREVAIVSPISGTTRDALETRIEVASIPVTFIDTAGVRETSDFIESQGVARAKARTSEADLILVVLDCTKIINAKAEVRKLLEECEAKRSSRVLVVLNKVDLIKDNLQLDLPWRTINVSCLNNTGFESLVNTIGVEVKHLSGGTSNDALLSRERQRVLLKNAIDCLEKATEEDFDLALMAQDLRDAGEAIGELSGAVVNEEILENIFSTFCIGK